MHPHGRVGRKPPGDFQAGPDTCQQEDLPNRAQNGRRRSGPSTCRTVSARTRRHSVDGFLSCTRARPVPRGQRDSAVIASAPGPYPLMLIHSHKSQPSAGTAAFTDSRGPQPAACRRQGHAGAAATGRAEAASSGSRDGGAKETARVHAAPAGRREVAVTGAVVDVVEGLEGEGREGGWTVVRVGEGGGAARAWVWGVRSGGRRPC